MFLLFDIGGTKMRLAVSRDGNSFAKPKIVEMPKDFDEGMSLFEKTAAELSGGEKIARVVGGVKGPLDKDNGVLLNPPDLPGWAGKPVRKTLEEALGVEVELENDAALAGLGEAVFGAGKGQKIVVYLTMSTGIGGARIVDGRIDENARGFEPGHQVIDLKSTLPCGCGGRGHLEAFIGGASIARRYGKKPEHINDSTVWDEVARILAYGLNNTVVHWSPHVVVLGGSLMHKVSIEKVSSHLKDILTIFPTPPPIVRAKLGDIGGLYGAVAYLHERG